MNHEESQPESVAIVGLAGRFPGARSLDEFWRNLVGGVESVTFFREDEAERSPFDPLPSEDDPHVVRARAMLEDADHFDASFFDFPHREAEMIDPQQRVFLECAWEALEDAGCPAESFPGLIGVFAGSSMNTYLVSNLMRNREVSDLAGAFQLFVASEKDYLTTRISYKLNLRGPSLNLQTACSTSLVAVCAACQSLLSYQCDAALAGGVSITFPQKRVQWHQEGGIVSPDGHCRPFDAAAAGTVSGDGAGVVVLKRLSDALAAGDNIRAVIKGCAMNNDGSLKVGFTAPSVQGQAEVIAMAHAAAGVAPETISFVEAHGTGTPLGDPVEIAGLTKAFTATTAEKGFCAVGSVKGNIGHLDVAAGIAGLIKTVLALERKKLPPTVHFKRPNPKLDLQNGPFFVNDQTLPWLSNGLPRRAGVSSFGIGGTNAHLVLEEAPPAPARGPARHWQILLLSAKTEQALDEAADNLARRLREEPAIDLADAAFTLQTGRKSFPHRRMLVCRDTEEALRILEARATRGPVATAGPQPAEARVAFMFPGQGAEHPGMARSLYECEPDFKEQFDRCCAALEPRLGLDLRTILFPGPGGLEEAERQLAGTSVAQPALFVVEYALARLWMKWGVNPAVMIGQGLGEYVAACLSGVMELEDALSLVAARGSLMQKQPAGAMLAVNLPELEVRPLLGRHLSLAAVNTPSLCVVSGPLEALEVLQGKLEDLGAPFQRLPAQRAFHSEMMEPAVRAYLHLVQKTRLNPPRIPFLSSVTGNLITAAEAADPNYWAGQLRETVRFAQGMGLLAAAPNSILLEVGPSRVLSALARETHGDNPAVTVLSSLGRGMEECSDQAQVITSLGLLWSKGIKVDWTAFYAHERRRRVPLPTYPFQRRRCCIDPGPEASPARLVRAGSAGLFRPIVTGPRAGSHSASGSGAGQTASSAVLTLAELKLMFENLSGMDLSKAPTSAPFLELGFDSLFLTQAGQEARKRFGVDVSLNQLLGEFSNLDSLAGHLAARRTEPFRPDTRRQGAEETPLSSSDEPGALATLPLTDGQQELWMTAQMGEHVSASYNESRTLSLSGPFDAEAMRRALDQLVRRHEALRMRFDAEGATAAVLAHQPFETPFDDLSGWAPTERLERLQAILEQEVRPPFEMLAWPLARARIIRLTPEEHRVSLTIHHVVCDGWSMGILVGELGLLYQANARGVPCSLPPPGSFVEFARSERERQHSPEYHAAEAYWTHRMSRLAPPMELPLDRPRPAKRTFAGSQINRMLSGEFAAGLRRYSVANGCTTFTTCFAAFNVLMHRLSGCDDIVIGVPAAGQVLGGFDRVVGHCANFLPLRGSFDPRLTFQNYLLGTRQRVLEAFQHYRYPFGKLVRKLGIPLQLNRVSLANVMFNMGHLRGEPGFDGLQASFSTNPRRFINFDLSLDLTETERGILVECTYSAELFDEATVGGWLDEYERLLKDLNANPGRLLGDLIPAPREKTAPAQQAGREARVEINPSADRPPTPTEEVVMDIWKSVLGLKRVAVHDNFFDLGGHSLLVNQVLSRVREAFDIELHTRQFFETPTVEGLAWVVEELLVEEIRA